MKKILLVDDQYEIRRLMRQTLGKSFEVFEAEDGENGLHLAKKVLPDLIILDIRMPGKMDGLQLLSAVRANPQLHSTLVILVSALQREVDVKRGGELGADAYFVKPFSPLQLLACVQECFLKEAQHE